jgi:proton-coupled amino acid transporter
LNIYAEFDKPKNFFMLSFVLILSLTVFVAATVGYVGYLAFGSKVKSVILLNLPHSDPSAIFAKICYILTIMGSFVLLINPIYYIIENTDCFKGKQGANGSEETSCL